MRLLLETEMLNLDILSVIRRENKTNIIYKSKV
jgi:hypothetical protein